MVTLYLKYRPQKISELDLTDVRELLNKIVSSGDIPHAFLFEGPRGSGKTSAARIMAKVLNCENLTKSHEPCNKCEQCASITKGTNIDVIELDAASHRGIDDVRLIRDSVKLAPARAKKKVYIIDEAHMLTTEASNALLKTLEEPPSHVVFILATTNPEKLLDTIKSRTVRVSFKKATETEIVKSLIYVLESEKKKFEKEVLELIARNVDGSLRDAKKVLEELLINDALTDLEKAQNYILSSGDFRLDDFFFHMHAKNITKSMEILSNAENAGVPSKTIYNQLVNKLKSYLFSVSGYIKDPSNLFSKKEALDLSEIIISSWQRFQNDVSDYMPFYLAACEWCGKENGDGSESLLNKKPLKAANQKVEIEDNKKETNGVNHEEKRDESFSSIRFIAKDGENISDDVWKQILQVVRSKNASTEALLRASKPMGFDGRILSLGVYYKFHKEKLESIPHKINLESCLQSALGKDIRVECYLTQPEVVVREAAVISSATSNGNASENKAVKSDVILSEAEDADLEKLADEVFGN